MTNTNNVTSSIGGNFDVQDNEPQGNWSFEYSQSNKKLSLNVYLESNNIKNNQLTCDIEKDDINEIINWLNVVKLNISK